MKKIIITGVTGMDGSHMADYLLNNTEHTIVAGARRLSNNNHKNIEHLKNNPRFKLIDLDITDPNNTEEVVRNEKPDYFINFAANSFVAKSWTMPVNHLETNCMAVLHQLEAIRKFAPSCRYYNAGSSEEFGDVVIVPQNEKHPLRPRSPYGASKAAARMLVKVYRDSYSLYAVQGWLFNHESERRGLEFVTRKVTSNVARIKKALESGVKFEPVELGNLNAKRDWGYAEDFVEGVWKMLNQEKYRKELIKNNGSIDFVNLKDYVLSTGQTRTIRELVVSAFSCVEIDGRWEYGKKPEDEKFVKNNTGETLVIINPKLNRAAEVHILLGDPSESKKDLQWEAKTSFDSLIKKMVLNDLNIEYQRV